MPKQLQYINTNADINVEHACACMHVCACMHARMSICRVALHDFRLYDILLPEKHSMCYSNILVEKYVS